MYLKWIGPLALLAVLFFGDQVRINRPGHKYRMTVEVETPDGVRSASGVIAVTPYRGYNPGGTTRIAGDAVFVELGGGKNLVALLLHVDRTIDIDAINYVALRAYPAATGKRVNFNDMNRQTGVVPVTGALVPVLLAFADPADPGSAKAVPPGDSETVLGGNYRLRGVSAEVVPNGFWPIDFGGVLGEPVTRGIAAKLPWLAGEGASAAAMTALKAAGLPGLEGIEAVQAFTRK